MQWDRIVDSAFDFSLKQRVANGVALAAYELRTGGNRIRSLRAQEIGCASNGREQLAISRSDDAATLVPFVQLFQLGAEHRRLDRIEARVIAANFVRVVGQAPVIAEARHAMRDFLVVGRDRAAVAPSAKIFAGIEAEAIPRRRSFLAIFIRRQCGRARRGPGTRPRPV